MVQIEPAPTPTLTASAPASIRASAPPRSPRCRRRFHGRVQALDRFRRSRGRLASGRGPCRSTSDIDAGAHQRLDALLAIGPDADRRADTQPAALVLAGVRDTAMVFWMSLTVMRPLQVVMVVDDQQLLDAIARAGSPSPRRASMPGRPVTRFSLVITSETVRSRRFSKRRSRLVRMPTSLPSLGDRQPGDVVALHDLQGVGDLLLGADGDRIDDHAALALLDLLDLRGLGRRSTGCGG